MGDMDGQVDHYIILGLPSGAEGSQISEKEITKAYRKKALELHPDKRPDDRNAHSDILQLNASYEILKDEKARKLFDDLLRIRRDKQKAQEEEQIISMKLKEEIARIRAMQANKVASATPTQRKEATVGGWESSMDGGGSGLDKEKVLKVSWEKIGDDYSAQRLRELFEKFGKVEDVVIKSSKRTLKRGSALVVMASKDAAVAATGTVCGDLTNPLLVLPLQPAVATAFTRPHEQHVEPDGPKLNNLVGAGYQSFEASVLKKMMQKV
ncbi:DNAJ heat shock N-terminal domain-containing protein [Actinidia rufa]|uniref:DNAJ heat shock N-terminal domain-containing protein n=1 Tax=Actinidia rufa TaxID=165716 RepID=A0A7J0FRF6_9ERIC|nr:DNAJ heat shock N-terminal domain-containing protein [Actinidia rufa]